MAAPVPHSRWENGAPGKNTSKNQVSCIKYKNLVQISRLGKNTQNLLKSEVKMIYFPVLALEGLFLWGKQAVRGSPKTEIKVRRLILDVPTTQQEPK